MAENEFGGHFHVFGPSLTFSTLVAGVAVFGLPGPIAHVFMRKCVRKPFSRLHFNPDVFDLGGWYGRFRAHISYSTRFRGRKQVQRPFSRFWTIPHVIDPSGWCRRFRAPVIYSTRFPCQKWVRRTFYWLRTIPTLSTPVAGVAVSTIFTSQVHPPRF